jgi:hypothetical protein
MERIDIAALELDTRHFLLLDPLQIDSEAALSWQSLPLRALAPPGFEAQAQQLPWLLAWQDLDAEQRALAMRLLTDPDEISAAPMCVALLRASGEAAFVRRHLRQLLVPHFPGGGRGVFRFYDPVVFVHLGWMLDDNERTVLFGPISSWSFPWHGEWFEQTTPSPGSRHVLFAPGAAAWQRIGRIGALYAVLETDSSWRAEPMRYGPQVEAWLIKAQTHGLDERDDVVAFARHGLLKHARFDTHPKVMDTLQQCARHPTRYRRLTSLWSDADWQTIAQELNRSMDAQHASPGNTDYWKQGAN